MIEAQLVPAIKAPFHYRGRIPLSLGVHGWKTRSDSLEAGLCGALNEPCHDHSYNAQHHGAGSNPAKPSEPTAYHELSHRLSA